MSRQVRGHTPNDFTMQEICVGLNCSFCKIHKNLNQTLRRISHGRYEQNGFIPQHFKSTITLQQRRLNISRQVRPIKNIESVKETMDMTRSESESLPSIYSKRGWGSRRQ